MKILVMGGTRFVGKSLVGKLLSQNHHIDIFTRGNKNNPEKTNLIKGDRNNLESIVKLSNEKYDVVYDISGRELEQTKLLIENLACSCGSFLNSLILLKSPLKSLTHLPFIKSIAGISSIESSFSLITS